MQCTKQLFYNQIMVYYGDINQIGLRALYWSLYHSPIKFVTKRARPLNQWIAKHTTKMNGDEGGATGGEYGIFKTKS